MDNKLFLEQSYSGAMYNAPMWRERVTATHVMLQSTGLHKWPLMVRGKSGIAMAMSLQMLGYYRVIVVRKRGEQTHGLVVEGSKGAFTVKDDVIEAVFIDDLIASGNTIENVGETFFCMTSYGVRFIAAVMWAEEYSPVYVAPTVYNMTEARRGPFVPVIGTHAAAKRKMVDYPITCTDDMYLWAYVASGESPKVTLSAYKEGVTPEEWSPNYGDGELARLPRILYDGQGMPCAADDIGNFKPMQF